MSSLLSTAYFPNIQYVSKFVADDDVRVELYETYPKQTFRNRCNILSSNGVLSLSVPVQKNYHTLTKDIKIDYSVAWHRNHRTAIMSAYKNSPFYDYYFYKFEPFFNKQETFLVDLNAKVLETIFSIIKLKAKYSFTEDYVVMSDANDFRDSISPKASKNLVDDTFRPEKYIQVFADRFDFVPNLSILDLIFNVGTESLDILKKSIIIK